MGKLSSGVACDEINPDAEIDRLAARLDYAISHKYIQPRNFYGVGGMKIFRDLIWLMRGMMKADHRFYKNMEYTTFHRRKRHNIKNVSCRRPYIFSKLRAKIGNKMNEGMIAPYRKVIDK